MILLELPESRLSAPVCEALLCLADDELLMGHRHSQWLGLCPFLEEDMTIASIAQDEIGHARAIYRLIWPEWEERDAGVVRRPPEQWRSCGFCERRDNTWEASAVRHWLYDNVEPLRWQTTAQQFGGEVPGLESLASKVLQEETFHQRHTNALISSLLKAPQARERLSLALNEALPLAAGLFVGLAAETARSLWDGLEETWFRDLDEESRPTSRFGVVFNKDSGDSVNSRRLRHPDFAEASAALLEVFAFDPTAKW